jgi:hypothetical protein
LALLYLPIGIFFLSRVFAVLTAFGRAAQWIAMLLSVAAFTSALPVPAATRP